MNAAKHLCLPYGSAADTLVFMYTGYSFLIRGIPAGSDEEKKHSLTGEIRLLLPNAISSGLGRIRRHGKMLRQRCKM